MNTNLSTSPLKPQPPMAGADAGTAFLRQIYRTNEDFRTAIIKEVTPEIAKRMLERNTRNRNLRKLHVKWLAKQMELGYWLFTGDSIRFDINGDLCDKQHTLHAIIESGIPSRYVIVSGLKPEVIDVIDTGIVRTAGDVLKMNGVLNANNLAAVCRRVLAFKANAQSTAFSAYKSADAKKITSSPRSTDVISNMRILEEVTNDPRYKEATDFAGKLYKIFGGITQSQYGLLYVLFSEKSPDDAWEFLSKFASGVGLEQNSPIYHLRRRIEQEAMGKIKYTDPLRLYWFFTCWNKFRNGETIKILQTPGKIDIPEIV